MSSLDSFDDDSAPSSSRLADAGRPANGEVADEEEEDDGVTCFRAKKLRSWQLARGVTDDKGGALTRLLPFDLDPDRVWEIMTALDLVDKVRGLWQLVEGAVVGEGDRHMREGVLTGARETALTGLTLPGTPPQ